MLKESLSVILSNSEISLLSSSFDVIGDIAIIKIPEELAHREKMIGDQILSKMKNVRTVLNQISKIDGEFRIRSVKLIAGEEKFETLYRESGCVFKVNVASVYFSPRLSTERERIANLIKDGEHVLNMFSGIGTFSIVAAKKKSCTVDSVDKNPEAIRLARDSLLLNRNLKGKVNPILSDAKDFSTSRRSYYDRVLMPLPERSFEFLNPALYSLKAGGVIHYYTHVSQEEFLSSSWIDEHLKGANIQREYSISRWKQVREVGPRYIQAVADVLVSS